MAVAAALLDGVVGLVSGFSLENIKLHLTEELGATWLNNLAHNVLSLFDNIVWRLLFAHAVAARTVVSQFE